MRNIFIITLTLIVSLSACNKIAQNEDMIQKDICDLITPYQSQHERNLCDANICNNYQQMWKEIIMERYMINESFYQKHLDVYSTSIFDKGDITYFKICYNFNIEWASPAVCDSFPIKINSEDNHTDFEYSPGEYLVKEQVRTILGRELYPYSINHLKSITNLKIYSEQDALNAVRIATNIKNYCVINQSLNYEGFPCITAIANYNNESASCTEVQLNLFTGEIEYQTVGPCSIY